MVFLHTIHAMNITCRSAQQYSSHKTPSPYHERSRLQVNIQEVTTKHTIPWLHS